MIANRCPPRCATILSLLLVLLGSAAAAADVPLRAFSATYKLYQGGMHIANSELRLEPTGDDWRWRMTTRARGLFSLFVRKQPFAETRFERGADGFRLREIVISDEKRPGRQEAARFDWQRGRVDILRRGKQFDLPLESGVYDYQSIHLLAASLPRRRGSEAMIDFYYKGRLGRSRVVYAGDASVNLDGEARPAHVFEQVLLHSNSRIKYYYDAQRPLLPLRIERLEAGESPTVMTLQSADWSL